MVGWRLPAELTGRADHERAEHMERHAGKIAGALLLVLSAYVSSLTPGRTAARRRGAREHDWSRAHGNFPSVIALPDLQPG